MLSVSVCIVGPNGVGKSTLLLLLTGKLNPVRITYENVFPMFVILMLPYAIFFILDKRGDEEEPQIGKLL